MVHRVGFLPLLAAVLGVGLPGATTAAPPAFDGEAWLAESANAMVDVVAYRAQSPGFESAEAQIGISIAMTARGKPQKPERPWQDPAGVCADKLVQGFAAATTARLGRREDLSDSLRPDSPAAYRERSSASYVLEVTLVNPSIAYRLRRQRTFAYRFTPKLRLIDNATSTLLWQYGETFKPPWDDPSLVFTEGQLAAAGSQAIVETIDRECARVAEDAIRAFRATSPAR